MNVFKYLVLISVISLEIVFASTDFWVFTYFSPIIITSSYYLLSKKANDSLLILLIGSIAIDFLNSRNVGLVAFSFLLSLLIMELISRQIAIVDNQSRTVKIFIVVIIYFLLYFGQMMTKNVLNIPQVLVLSMLYLTTLMIATAIVKAVDKTQKNVIKI